jgi:hypothetical protein
MCHVWYHPVSYGVSVHRSFFCRPFGNFPENTIVNLVSGAH